MFLDLLLRRKSLLKVSGCSLVAFLDRGVTTVNSQPEALLPAGGELILVGTDGAQHVFVQAFPPSKG